jgi:protein phosphatase
MKNYQPIGCSGEWVINRFGVIEPALGVVYTRTGRRFFADAALERQFLERIRQAITSSGLWDELNTDWLCLDCELMPWSVKAQELLRLQYAHAATSGVAVLDAVTASLAKASRRLSGLEDLANRTAARLESLGKYRDAYRNSAGQLLHSTI